MFVVKMVMDGNRMKNLVKRWKEDEAHLTLVPTRRVATGLIQGTLLVLDQSFGMWLLLVALGLDPDRWSSGFEILLV